MSPSPALSKSTAARVAKKQTISTSDARANFAEALGMAHEENTVIGFDRYGKLVAALVPIDAVLMLAGRGDDVDPAVRGKIERMSRVFLTAQAMRRPAAARDERMPQAKAQRRSDKRDKKKKAKAAHGRRPRKISRKI